MTCSVCGREITGGRMVLPLPSGRVRTVCMPCFTAPRLPEPASDALIDKDGRELPIAVERKRSTTAE